MTKRIQKMTVSYNLDVSSASVLNFFKLLFRWRGSIWKSIWLELSVWIVLYYAILVVYRCALPAESQAIFGRIAGNLDEKLDSCIPLTFMLGFFVTVIVDRWKNVFTNMGFIENVALAIAANVRGRTHDVVLVRRTMVRYMVLSQILVFRDISLRVRRRFPNIDSIIKAGFIHENEAEMLEKVHCNYNKYWVPINWATAMLEQQLKSNVIAAAPLYNAVWQEFKTFRHNLSLLCNFDWVPIPLAYPQMVFSAVRCYFIVCLVSRQNVELTVVGSVNYYFPLLTVIQFCVFVGWMKVAEGLLNPLGEDDDDYECNFLIDKNIATGMAIVDQTYDQAPVPTKDMFSDPDFAPFYPEDVIKDGTDHALVGSAQTVQLAKPEDIIDMVAVRPTSPMVTGGPRESMLRRMSNALKRDKRSQSVQPTPEDLPSPKFQDFSKSYTPQRAYTNFELSNGFDESRPSVANGAKRPSVISEGSDENDFTIGKNDLSNLRKIRSGAKAPSPERSESVALDLPTPAPSSVSDTVFGDTFTDPTDFKITKF